MKKSVTILISTLLFTSLYAQDMHLLANDLKLYAGTKAAIQWQRIFSSDRRMKKYKIDLLPEQTKHQLKLYLIDHAADSEQPIVPGL